MTLQDSPSLEDYSDGIPSQPKDPSAGKRRTRILLIIIFVLIIILLGFNFMQSDTAARLVRRGSISGNAINANDQPITVEVIVFGTEITKLSDENGYFQVDDIPAGENSIIIAYGDIATEVIATVNPAENTSIGTVKVPTDIEIDY